MQPNQPHDTFEIQTSKNDAANPMHTQSLRNILIIDPDPRSRKNIESTLRDGFHRCHTHGAASGEEGLALAEKKDIDCVVLCEYLTDFRVNDLVRYFASHDSFPSAPVVVFGDYWSEEGEQAVLRAGAHSFLRRSELRSRAFKRVITSAIADDRMMRIIDVQNRQIQALSEERERYIDRTDELAHEILTPLASIQEFVSIVLDGIAGPISDDQGKHLAYARGGCSMIQKTIETLVVSQDLERILDNSKTQGTADTRQLSH